MSERSERGTSSARPAALEGYAAATASMTRAVEGLGRLLRGVLDDVRARCVEAPLAVPDVDGDLLRLSRQLDELGGFARRVGEAFAAAGRAGAGGVFSADSTALGLGADGYIPAEHVVAVTSRDEWWHAAFGRDLCAAGYGYLGSGFIDGPDGRRYALVVPYVDVDGVRYNADGDGRVAASVDDLFGHDPDWRTVDVRTGVERHRGAPSLIERVLIGIGQTAATYAPQSRAGDVAAVRLRLGAQPELVQARLAPVVPEEIPPDDLTRETPGAVANSIALAPEAGDFVVGALNADLGAHDAFQVVFQENDDGRRRALYTRVDVTPPDGEHPAWELSPSYVTGPDVNTDRVMIRYQRAQERASDPDQPGFVVTQPDR